MALETANNSSNLSVLQMPLEITRSFVENRDGTYELFKCPKVQVESIAEAYSRMEKQPTIRPLELKTFLRVGEYICWWLMFGCFYI